MVGGQELCCRGWASLRWPGAYGNASKDAASSREHLARVTLALLSIVVLVLALVAGPALLGNAASPLPVVAAGLWCLWWCLWS